MSELLKTDAIIETEWKIVDIFENEDDHLHCYVSPTFNFAETTWRILLTGRMRNNPESASLIIMRNEHHNIPLEYIFAFKKLDCSAEVLDRGFLKDDEKQAEYRFIHFSEVINRRSVLAPSGVMTILCSLKLDASKSAESGEPQRKKLKKLDTLSQNMKDLFTNKFGWDITIKVKDREFKAHRAVLAARSKVFADMFQHETTEKKTELICIRDCEPKYFEEFLGFLYHGTFEGELSEYKAYCLFETSAKYGVPELNKICCEYLISILSIENWFLIAEGVSEYNNETLFTAIQNFFNNNLNQIVQSPKWEYLMERHEWMQDLACRLLSNVPQLEVVE